MLNFLRNHQRKFFIVITVVTVSSFVFFGTFSTLVEPKREMPDREVVLGLGGKPLMQRDLYALCQMLATSGLNASTGKQGGMPNLFNDGVIEKELLSNGMSMLLVEPYFASLKPDLEERIKKMKQFRFYSHPQAPHINALSVYQRFAPSLVQHLERIKKQNDACTLETVELLFQIYQDQSLLPPDMLKQILLFQQQQQGVPADPRLSQGDLSLFGFTSLEDWFGPHFVELNAQFIANAAALAEEKGYEIKKDEIRADLFHNIYTSYKRLAHENALNSQDMQQYFQRKIQQLGLDEKVVFDTWRKIMLFRRLFADVGGSVLIDSLAFQHFQEYSKQRATVALYELPDAMHLNDFQTLLKFQLYLESIALHPQSLRTNLGLPRETVSLEQMEKRCPELVERECEVEYSEVRKSLLASEISLKETWEWESSDANWVLLQKQFSELSDCKAANPEERFLALDALDSKRRVAIDSFARLQMIDALPQKIYEALDKAALQKTKVSLRAQSPGTSGSQSGQPGGGFVFSGIQDRTPLFSTLENAPLSEEGAPLGDTGDPLYCFSGDREHFYRIKVLHRDEAKRVLDFSKSLSDGTLDLLLTRYLEEGYPEARKKNPGYYQTEKGGWKPLKEVKDSVGRFLFADLLKSIEDSYKSQAGTLPGKAGELPLVFYPNYRFLLHMEQVKAHLQRDARDSAWVANAEEEKHDSLLHQFLLKKSQRTIARSDSLAFSKEEMFTLGADQWSGIKLGARGALGFFKVIEHTQSAQLSPDQIKQGHEILSLDARKQLMMELITLMDQKKAIDITQQLRGEGDEY
jgi:hypothetical protein